MPPNTNQNIYDEELSGYDNEEDDMGMGVSSTIKNKKPARPKPEEVSELCLEEGPIRFPCVMCKTG